MCTGKTKKPSNLQSRRSDAPAMAAPTAANAGDGGGDEPRPDNPSRRKAAEDSLAAGAPPLMTALAALDNPDQPVEPELRRPGRSRPRAPQPPPPARDREAERMSADNTLKEVPSRMPECEFTHVAETNEPVFTNEQLL